MQRYPSIARDYRAGGSGAAPAGGSYRGNTTAGEVPQWLVDTCNGDNEYDEEYEYQQHDADGRLDYSYTASTSYPRHNHEVASRKSSLDTLETFRADNTTAGTSYRQQLRDYNDDAGGQSPYMFEPYEQFDDVGYASTSQQDYYYEDNAQDAYHDQERAGSYRAEQQPQAPQRQSFKEYQRYVMEQQQYLPSNNKGGKGIGRGLLGAVGGFFNDRVVALQKQGQSRSNLMAGTGGRPNQSVVPPRQSSMRHGDGSLRSSRYQEQRQSQRRMIGELETPAISSSQHQLPEDPQPVSRQEELMMMELSGDAIPLRGGNNDRRGIQRQSSRRLATQSQWEGSGPRLASSRSSVHSSESTISSQSSKRALRYHDPEYKREEDEEDDYVDTSNGQDLICGWGREDEDEDVSRYNTGSNSYDMRPPHRASHPRYQRTQYYSNASIRSHRRQFYEEEEPEAYESFQDMLPRQKGESPKDKLVGMVKRQVSFRPPEPSRPPLVPNGRGHSKHYGTEAMPRYQAQDPPGRNEMLPKRRADPIGQVPARSHIDTVKQQLLQQSQNNNSLTSLTNYEIKTKTEDGGREGTEGKERRVSDVTFEPMLEQLLNLNGSKSSLNSSLNDSGSLSAEQIFASLT